MIYHRNPTRALLSIPSNVILRGIFNDFECSKIILDATKELEPVKGMVGENETVEIRNSTVRWMQNTPSFKWVFDKIDVAINNANNEWFNFDLLGYSQIQFTEYAATDSQFYTWHTDLAWFNENRKLEPELSCRKLSCAIVLNQQEDKFEGGNFEMDKITQPTTPYLDAGDGIIFPSFVWHQVTPVTSGVRYSLVVWVLGPSFK